ncbi:MAG: hypothetical protein ACLUG4_06530 [Bacilli bacterium]|jgi:hypothetical protein
MKEKFILPTPSKEEVDKYLSLWDSLDDYVEQEHALDKLFFGVFKTNDTIENILIKCSVLNDFYSTNIFKVYPIAKHILGLNIDDRLNKHDPTLVNDIANVTISGKSKYFYSFASKYCSHHDPLNYPIYDSYVEKVLKYFKKKDKLIKFNNDDLKHYELFKQILLDFQKAYNIEEYNLKDLDRYLWQLGKKYFPNKY